MARVEEVAKQESVVELATALFAAGVNGVADLAYGPKGMQGASELAHALFSGQGFVLYGPGQGTLDSQKEQGHEAQVEQPVHEREGMSR